LEKEIEMNICVTNLSRETSEDVLRYAFSAFGQVRLVSIVGDGANGELKAFVSMPVEHEARAAIGAMNGKNLGGRIVQVVGQAKKNILPTREKPRVSASDRGRGGRTGYGRVRRGKRRRS
jgi:RNA recognition motif-containing protein